MEPAGDGGDRVAVDIERFAARDKIRVHALGQELYLTPDPVGVYDLAHGNKFQFHIGSSPLEMGCCSHFTIFY